MAHRVSMFDNECMLTRSERKEITRQMLKENVIYERGKKREIHHYLQVLKNDFSLRVNNPRLQKYKYTSSALNRHN